MMASSRIPITTTQSINGYRPTTPDPSPLSKTNLNITKDKEDKRDVSPRDMLISRFTINRSVVGKDSDAGNSMEYSEINKTLSFMSGLFTLIDNEKINISAGNRPLIALHNNENIQLSNDSEKRGRAVHFNTEQNNSTTPSVKQTTPQDELNNRIVKHYVEKVDYYRNVLDGNITLDQTIQNITKSNDIGNTNSDVFKDSFSYKSTEIEPPVKHEEPVPLRITAQFAHSLYSQRKPKYNDDLNDIGYSIQKTDIRRSFGKSGERSAERSFQNDSSALENNPKLNTMQSISNPSDQSKQHAIYEKLEVMRAKKHAAPNSSRQHYRKDLQIETSEDNIYSNSTAPTTADQIQKYSNPYNEPSSEYSSQEMPKTQGIPALIPYQNEYEEYVSPTNKKKTSTSPLSSKKKAYPQTTTNAGRPIFQDKGYAKPGFVEPKNKEKPVVNVMLSPGYKEIQGIRKNVKNTLNSPTKVEPSIQQLRDAASAIPVKIIYHKNPPNDPYRHNSNAKNGYTNGYNNHYGNNVIGNQTRVSPRNTNPPPSRNSDNVSPRNGNQSPRNGNLSPRNGNTMVKPVKVPISQEPRRNAPHVNNYRAREMSDEPMEPLNVKISLEELVRESQSEADSKRSSVVESLESYHRGGYQQAYQAPQNVVYSGNFGEYNAHKYQTNGKAQQRQMDDPPYNYETPSGGSEPEPDNTYLYDNYAHALNKLKSPLPQQPVEVTRREYTSPYKSNTRSPYKNEQYQHHPSRSNHDYRDVPNNRPQTFYSQQQEPSPTVVFSPVKAQVSIFGNDHMNGSGHQHKIFGDQRLVESQQNSENSSMYNEPIRNDNNVRPNFDSRR
jgi:hypothetical protein